MRITLALLVFAGLVLGFSRTRSRSTTSRARYDARPSDRQVVAAWAFLVAGLVGMDAAPANRLGALMVATGFALLAAGSSATATTRSRFTVFFLSATRLRARRAHRARVPVRPCDRPARAAVHRRPGTRPRSRSRWRSCSPRREREPAALVRPARSQEPAPRLAVTPTRSSCCSAHTRSSSTAYSRRCSSAGRPEDRAGERREPAECLAPLLLAAVARRACARAQWHPDVRRRRRPASTYASSGGRSSAQRAADCAPRGPAPCAARAAPASAGSWSRLERTPAGGLRDALARALGDPTLEVAFWLPERGEFADAARPSGCAAATTEPDVR